MMLGRSRKGERAQALPIAIVALAAGAVLLTPMLQGASTSSRFANQVGAQAKERYSMDAGVEWSGFRLLSDPRITTDSSFNTGPISPMPATVNGAPFPTTEIRFVAGAGAVEAQVPAWQTGGGDQCYDFSASDSGTLSARVSVDAGQVWMALLPAAAACVRPPGLLPLSGASPYSSDFALAAAGAQRLLIGTDAATTGSIELSVPAATYEVRSQTAARGVIARLVAGYSGVRVESWHLN